MTETVGPIGQRGGAGGGEPNAGSDGSPGHHRPALARLLGIARRLERGEPLHEPA